MKTWAIRIGIAVAALILAFLGGRYSNRPKVSEEAAKVAVTASSSASTEAKNVATDEVTDRKTTIRKVAARPAAPAPATGICPECPAVDETLVEESVRRKLLDTGMVTSIATSASRTEERTTKVTEWAKPSWSVSFLAGWKPDDPSPAPKVYQLQADHRVLGTVWAGAWVQGEDVPDRPEKRGGWKVTVYGAMARVEF